MRKHLLTTFMLVILVILFTSISFADDMWTPRVTNYDTSLFDQVRALWAYAWKFFAYL